MDTWNAPRDDPDELAIQRYRYLLRTAPPEALEAAHEEAFAQLTPEQRSRVLEGLATQVDPAEVRYADESPQGLARLATRAELRRPGTMERAFADNRGWGGVGGGFGGSFFGMLAGAFIGTTIASALFPADAVGAGVPGGEAAGEGGWSDPGAAEGGLGEDGGRVQSGDWDDGGQAGGPGGWDDGGDLGGFGGDGGFDIGF